MAPSVTSSRSTRLCLKRFDIFGVVASWFIFDTFKTVFTEENGVGQEIKVAHRTGWR